MPGTPFVGKMADFLIDQAGLRDKFKKRIGAKEAAHPLLASGSLSQDQIIEQFVNVLRDLAARMPLLIVLDDLHWADTASIDLVFRLIRRLADSRLFILCALRPHDLRSSPGDAPHPLEKVINEARRLRGDIWLDLTKVSERNRRDFIDASRIAVEALKARAARITDSGMRRGFVDDVPEHAALQRLYAGLAANAA
ncbi:MAG: AAA family ATPase [Thermoflexales bacterium]